MGDIWKYIPRKKGTSFHNQGDFQLCSSEHGKIGLFSGNFLQIKESLQLWDITVIKFAFLRVLGFQPEYEMNWNGGNMAHTLFFLPFPSAASSSSCRTFTLLVSCWLRNDRLSISCSDLRIFWSFSFTPSCAEIPK